MCYFLVFGSGNNPSKLQFKKKAAKIKIKKKYLLKID